MINSIKLFSGSSHPELAKKIAKHLGLKLSEMEVKRFACGETYAKPLESVRGVDVFLVQTATHMVNEDYMELFVMLDSLKRSFASSVHVIIPHYGYARQDRVATPREPISAKLFAKLIQSAGADHVITMHLHSEQIQGFFDFPVDNLSSRKLFAEYIKSKKIKDLVIVSPDAGGAKAAKKFADRLGASLAIIHKNRPSHNISEVMHVVGDVKNKTCIIYDDIIDTGGSVSNAKKALLAHGANSDVYLIATHAVFSNSALETLEEAKFKEIIVTDTIPVKDNNLKELKILSVAPLMADIIKNVHEGRSITDVLDNEV